MTLIHFPTPTFLQRSHVPQILSQNKTVLLNHPLEIRVVFHKTHPGIETTGLNNRMQLRRATSGSNHEYHRDSAEFEIRFPLPSPKRAIENLTAESGMNYSLGDLLLHNIHPRERTR
ncbi:hypothetical protein CDAR_219401 [Caerostris darwini]|uniref:Uncharacterized protein n=1 Tax=Caerostris darwini TaxID=1538125 RepID=A0AAV4TI41_9ARAC|nr:hypothetical protein CDAR_219401 [Caerostris darwini]